VIYHLSLECKSAALINVHLQILKGGLEGREGKDSITTYKILADSNISIKCCCSKLSYNTTIQLPITYTGIPKTAYSELLNFTSEA
jgi:hypothetical protein